MEPQGEGEALGLRSCVLATKQLMQLSSETTYHIPAHTSLDSRSCWAMQKEPLLAKLWGRFMGGRRPVGSTSRPCTLPQRLEFPNPKP